MPVFKAALVLLAVALPVAGASAESIAAGTLSEHHLWSRKLAVADPDVTGSVTSRADTRVDLRGEVRGDSCNPDWLVFGTVPVERWRLAC